MKICIGLILFGCLAGCKKSLITQEHAIKLPHEIVAQASDDEWRSLDLDNTLYLTLDSGLVVMELLPAMAPAHVENTKALVRSEIFDGTNFYRVIDGFVAQGGPLFDNDTAQLPAQGSFQIDAEFTQAGDLTESFTAVDQEDGYADITGFNLGFAVGYEQQTRETWLLHCYGALGMGRTDELNSGGTELYIVIGHSQRYLDRNTTVFGRVISGMEHIQQLKRGTSLAGPVDLTGHNIIRKVRIANDLDHSDILPIEVMKTNSQSFIDFVTSRKNRQGSWFVYQHNYIDACAIPVPVRLKTKP